jgi:hypothetical protein
MKFGFDIKEHSTQRGLISIGVSIALLFAPKYAAEINTIVDILTAAFALNGAHGALTVDKK